MPTIRPRPRRLALVLPRQPVDGRERRYDPSFQGIRGCIVLGHGLQPRSDIRCRAKLPHKADKRFNQATTPM